MQFELFTPSIRFGATAEPSLSISAKSAQFNLNREAMELLGFTLESERVAKVNLYVDRATFAIAILVTPNGSIDLVTRDNPRKGKIQEPYLRGRFSSREAIQKFNLPQPARWTLTQPSDEPFVVGELVRVRPAGLPESFR